MTHPYRIFIWQSNNRGGEWIEPIQAYTQEYAIFVAGLIHKETRSAIKVVRYGLHVSCFPNKETVEKIERHLARREEQH